MNLPLLVTVLLTASVILALAQSVQSDHLNPHTRDVVIPEFNKATCEEGMPKLVCNVIPTSGYFTSGFVIFTPTWIEPKSCYIHINATIYNLTANAQHGFHVHTYGDLTTEDGLSTGGHFTDPAGSDISHGLPTDSERHWGDFGNLEANANGVAGYDRVDDVIRLGGIVGRAITIHADSDKGSSDQPTGDAGDRIGYCVIGYKNPEITL